jgi:glycosyltransferase involved in cell wall biosynthesis
MEALDRFVAGFEAGGGQCEVLLVDDGSTDGSRELGAELAGGRPYLRLLALRRNFGQTAAMAAGFDLARGEVVVPLDADLQNDPEDIGRLLAKLDEGYDVVSGWRRRRKDCWLTRRLPSTVANWIISRVGGLRLHDYGCTLKAYRRDVLQHVKLYGEMHRFLPLHAKWTGARVAEVEVRHHPREQGRSKYGLGRTFKVLLDLITVKFLGDYATKPLYFFGGLGFLLCLIGVICGGVTLVQKLTMGAWVHRNPLLLLAVFLFIVGLLLVFLGLLGELLVRVYHEAQGKPIYLLAQPPPAEPGGPTAPDGEPTAPDGEPTAPDGGPTAPDGAP